jgi:hypothetical protein
MYRVDKGKLGSWFWVQGWRANRLMDMHSNSNSSTTYVADE